MCRSGAKGREEAGPVHGVVQLADGRPGGQAIEQAMEKTQPSNSA
jgi:hypothetical protein